MLNATVMVNVNGEGEVTNCGQVQAHEAVAGVFREAASCERK